MSELLECFQFLVRCAAIGLVAANLPELCKAIFTKE